MTTREQDIQYEGLVCWVRANVAEVIDMTPSMVGSMDQALAAHAEMLDRFGVHPLNPEERRAYITGLAHGVGSVLAVAMEGRLALAATQELIHRIGFPIEIENVVVGLPVDPFEEDA